MQLKKLSVKKRPSVLPILSNALKNMGITAQQAQEWLALAGIDPKRRGETLSLQDFANLTNTFEQIKNQ